MKLMDIISKARMLAAAVAFGLIIAPAIAVAGSVKVAGIFTLPVEQQWISRIHIALSAAEKRGEIGTYIPKTFLIQITNASCESMRNRV